mmetsp:Transcript_28787/g.79031  ORF Transcript_28787/g.79031 Transcript_28787/m.79031 type:complete len:247 (+) Transcript_28787:385-1125(+)
MMTPPKIMGMLWTTASMTMTVAAVTCTMRSSQTVKVITASEITNDGNAKCPAACGNSPKALCSKATARRKQTMVVPGVMSGKISTLLSLRKAEVGGVLWKMCCVKAQRLALVRTDATMHTQPRIVFSASSLPFPAGWGPQSAASAWPEGRPHGRFSRTPPTTSKAAAAHFTIPMLSNPQQTAVSNWNTTQQAMTMRLTDTETNDSALLVSPNSRPWNVPTKSKKATSRGRSPGKQVSLPPVEPTRR